MSTVPIPCGSDGNPVRINPEMVEAIRDAVPGEGSAPVVVELQSGRIYYAQGTRDSVNALLASAGVP